MIKKLLATVMALILLIQAMPSTLAAGEISPLTLTELEAANALAGFGEGAPGFHEGMELSEDLTACQLMAYIDIILFGRIHTLENYCEDLENTLHDMEKNNPSAYAAATGGQNAGMAEKVHTIFRSTEKIRARYEYWRSRLDFLTSVILSNTNLIEKGSLTDYEYRYAVHQTRDAVREIREIRTAIVREGNTHEASLEEHLGQFSLSAGGSPVLQGSGSLGAWAGQTLNVHASELSETPVSTGSLFPQRKTFLGRISPISTAGADSKEDMTVVVADEKHIYLRVVDEEDNLMPEAHFQVTDMLAPGTQSEPIEAEYQEDIGYFVLPITGFMLREDLLSMKFTITADGYRKVVLKGMDLKKGGTFKYIMVKDDGSPYVTECSFDNNDILYSEYTALYSEKNDRECDIDVTVTNPSGKHYLLHVIYEQKAYDPEKASASEQYYFTREIKADDEEVSFTFRDTWRSMLKPGGAQYSLNIDGEDVEASTDDKRDLLLVLEETDDSAGGSNSAQKGSPELKTGSYALVKVPLRVDAAVVKVPVSGEPNAANFFSGMSGLLDFKFPMNVGSKVMSGGSVGFDLPFADFVPKINVATNGSFCIFVGKDVGDFTKDGGPLKSWKSHDAKQIKEYSDMEGKKYAFVKKMDEGYISAQLQSAGGLKIGKVQGSISVFLGMVFNVEYSEANDEWTNIDIHGVVGGTIGVEASFSSVFTVVGVPVSVGFSISISLGIAFDLGGTVKVKDKYLGDDADEMAKKLGFNPKIGGFSLFFKLMVTAFLGVGVKGFISATINGYCYFNVLLTQRWDGYASVKVSGGGGVYILLEAVLAHLRFDLYDSGEQTIYTKEWNIKGSSLPFSDIFISRAYAEEEIPEESRSYTATDYPELAPEVSLEYGPVAQNGSNIQILNINDEIYAFYIVPGAGANGKNRVTWRNLTTGSTGTFEDVLQEAADPNMTRYTRRIEDGFYMDPTIAFGEREVDLGTVETVNLEEREALRQRGDSSFESLYNHDDILFSVTKVEANDSRAYGPAYGGNLYTLTVLNGTLDTSSGDRYSFDGEPEIYILGFRPDPEGGFTCELPSVHDNSYNHFVKPSEDMTWKLLWSEKMTGTQEELRELMSNELVTSSVFFDRLVNEEGRYYFYDIQVGVSLGSYLTSFTFDVPDIHRFTDEHWQVKDQYIRYSELTAGILAAKPDNAGEQVRITASGQPREAHYYEVVKTDDGKDQLWLRANAYSAMIDEQKEILYYNMLRRGNNDVVFYLLHEETEQDGDLYHMKVARINHYVGEPDNLQYTFIDPDITIPGACFQLQTVNNIVYAYWTEAVQDPDDKEKTVYRLKSVAFDLNNNIGSDDFVLAQFKTPATHTLHSLLLTSSGNEGTGYYAISENNEDVSESSVYSFPFRFVASMDLDGVTLEGDLLHRGENDIIVIRVMNTGNMALHSFSLSEYLLEGNDATKVLTAHCDTLSPDNCYLHLEGDDESLNIEGPEAIWRAEPPLTTLTQHYWETKQVTRTFSGPDSWSDYEQTVSLDSAEILPGQVGFFYMVVHTPSDWENKKEIRFEVEDFSASRNQLRSLAQQNGLPVPLNASEDQDVTWTRGPRRNRAASSGGMYTAMSGTPQHATLNYDLDNLVVKHRVYVTPSGERRLSFTLNNDAADYATLRLYCEVYLDGSETPIYMDLPYDPNATSHEKSHTFDMPVSALANGTNAKKARVSIRGIDSTEMGHLDNTFEVMLGDRSPLKIIVHPQSRSALAGETVTMTVKAAGGNPPYSYQWQEYMGDSLGWQNIAGANEATLTLKNVTKGMNGRKYRCVVTDRNLDSVTSDTAILTVRDSLLPTGDASQPVLILLAAAGLLVCWLLIRRKQGRRE